MWDRIRNIAIVVTPFVLGFLWGQCQAPTYTASSSERQEALEAAYAEGWREGSRYVVVHHTDFLKK